MWVDEYHWHYDYPRLAWDTGFCFDKYKYPNLDKNKICLIDIDRITRERDVSSVDRNISIVVQYVLENDQAVVLDANFVKLFRLSQLSVEYLLFCKKYLDRTVVLLKKELARLKEELKELKFYTEELETHISSSRTQPMVTFKCEKCSKMFASEDYLNSHLKRRHIGEENIILPIDSEAEKLHLEIKQLKERLNNTEKFIQEKPSEKEVENLKSHFKEDKDEDDKTTKLVSEIHDSFEKFQKQVEEKMSNLQSEKNFFTDKYDKLFEVVLQFKNKEQAEAPKVEENKINSKPETTKIETTTQTSENEIKKSKTKQLQVYTVHHDVIDMKPDTEEKTPQLPSQENLDEKIEKKLSNFEETIDGKISAGLGNIQHQMQAFWEKLAEAESSRVKVGDYSVQREIQENIFPHESLSTKPKIKPRTKLTKPTTPNFENQKVYSEKVKNELEKMSAIEKALERAEPKKSQVRFETDSTVKTTVVQPATGQMYGSTSEEDEAEKSVEEEIEDSNFSEETKPKHISDIPFVQKVNSKKSLDKVKVILPAKKIKSSTTKSNLPLKDSTGSRKFEAKSREKEKIKAQLNESIGLSLQEMGISPLWTGIPKKTYQRAYEIVSHKAVLNKKSLPNFDPVKRAIEKLLKSEKEVKKNREKNVSKAVKESPSKTKTNTIKFQIRKHKWPQPQPQPTPVTIRNRSLYDTESDTDMKVYLPKKFENKKGHGAVIEELHSKFSSKQPIEDGDSVSDLNSEIPTNEDLKEMKSVLKSTSTEGSVVKKRVIFDVEDSDKKDTRKGNLDKNKVSGDIFDFEYTE